MFDNAITLEFYIARDKHLRVVYNNSDYLFSDFWKNVEDAEKICYKIYQEFHKQFPKKFKGSDVTSKNWEEVVLKIINNHLREYDDILDVFIRTNGETVFHLEY